MDKDAYELTSSELSEEISACRSFLESKAGAGLLKMLDGQITTRTQELILKPLDNILEAVQVEYAKGEIAGLMLARNYPELYLGTLEEELSKRKSETKKEET